METVSMTLSELLGITLIIHKGVPPNTVILVNSEGEYAILKNIKVEEGK